MRVDSKMSSGPNIRNGRKTATRNTALQIDSCYQVLRRLLSLCNAVVLRVAQL